MADKKTSRPSEGETRSVEAFRGIDPDPLTDEEFAAAAQELGCAVAAIKAVTEVEAAGNGFFKPPDNRPKILFEAHLFSKFTGGKYDGSHPAISSAKWNQALYKRGPAEYDRLAQAMGLDRAAALKSASWGKFQILGMHYGTCGYADVEGFVKAQCESERAQLDAFVKFIKANPKMHAALRERRWDEFALRYNGTGYKQNKYDTKLAAAFAKFAASTAPIRDERAKVYGAIREKAPAVPGEVTLGPVEAGRLTIVADLELIPAEVVAEFIAALDDVHRALGGTGLEVEGHEIGLLSCASEGVVS
jgi:hypothetical protein